MTERFQYGTRVRRRVWRGGVKRTESLVLEEVFYYFPAFRVLFIEQFRVKLHTKQRPGVVLHRLDGASLIGGCEVKAFRQFLHFVKVGVPDRYRRRQVAEQAVYRSFNGKEASFPLRAFISFARLNSAHQSNWRAKGEGHLLMAATNSQYWLGSFLYYFKHTGQRFWGVHVPGMTLSAQNYVGRPERIYAFERNRVERLGENFEVVMHPAQHRPQFAGTCALTIKCVVDEIYQHVR